MKKICTGCKHNKNLEDFNNKKSAVDGKHSRCKECTREYTRDHYKNNKKYYLDKSTLAKIKLKEWYVEFKKRVKLCRVW